MPPLTEDAIILQVFAYGDTSKILRLLTRGHGVVSVIAKGAQRPKSRYGGVLEPFTEGTATLYLKETRDLQTLGGFELVRSGQRLGADLVRFGGASLLAEVVLLTASSHPDPLLFERIRGALDRIGDRTGAALETQLLAELWALVAHLGFAPELERCLACGREIEPAEEALFDYAAGGVRCAGCPGARLGRQIPGAARIALGELLTGVAPPLERTEAHWALFSRFVSYHVLEGRDLRSLAFLATALEPE